MKLLIFSKDYFYNALDSNCLNKKTIHELQKLKIDVHMIVQTHPSYSYDTMLFDEDEIKIVKVQQYPFANDYYNTKYNNQNNYYADNVRAQEGVMFFAKRNITFDYIVNDNIRYGLAAQSYAKIFEIPSVYLKYQIDNSIRNALTLQSFLKENGIPLGDLKYPNQDLKENLSEVEKWVIKGCDFIIDAENIYMNGDSNQKSVFPQKMFYVFKEYIATPNSSNGESI
jgi:hypothetical protein